MEPFREIEALDAHLRRSRKTFLSRAERDRLRKNIKEIDERYRTTESIRPVCDKLLQHLLWLGGASSRELDRIGLSILEDNATPKNIGLLARLALRFLQPTSENRLIISHTQVAALKQLLKEYKDTREPAMAVLLNMKEYHSWQATER